MSRIGKQPITVPANVTVTIENNLVTVKGPKGELSRQINKDMKLTLENGVLTVERPSDEKTHRSMHGLSRTLINNMVVGVTTGFSKSLEIAGVGYRAAKQGNNINFTLGFSHPVVKEPPAGITFEVQLLTKSLSAAQTKKKSAQLQLKSALCVRLNPIKAKVFVMKANTFVVRWVKLALKARSNF